MTLSNCWDYDRRGIKHKPWERIKTTPVSLPMRFLKMINPCHFFLKKQRTKFLFVGPLITLFWTAGDVCPGFQSQGGFPCLCALLPVRNRFFRFTSCVTLADLFAARMVAELFHPCTCTCLQVLVGLESRIKCATA